MFVLEGENISVSSFNPSASSRWFGCSCRLWFGLVFFFLPSPYLQERLQRVFAFGLEDLYHSASSSMSRAVGIVLLHSPYLLSRLIISLIWVFILSLIWVFRSWFNRDLWDLLIFGRDTLVRFDDCMSCIFDVRRNLSFRVEQWLRATFILYHSLPSPYHHGHSSKWIFLLIASERETGPCMMVDSLDVFWCEQIALLPVTAGLTAGSSLSVCDLGGPGSAGSVDDLGFVHAQCFRIPANLAGGNVSIFNATAFGSSIPARRLTHTSGSRDFSYSRRECWQCFIFAGRRPTSRSRRTHHQWHHQWRAMPLSDGQCLWVSYSPSMTSPVTGNAFKWLP
jgi:hypothetical protein